MLMTEDEAKGKWCPMVRIANGDHVVNDGVFVRPDAVIHPTFCVASKCAMWRRSDHPMKLGYCGLAGIPIEE